jgi:hypothetical protein
MNSVYIYNIIEWFSSLGLSRCKQALTIALGQLQQSSWNEAGWDA